MLTSADGESSWSISLSLISRVLAGLGNTESKVTLRTLGTNYVRSTAASDMNILLNETLSTDLNTGHRHAVR